MMLEKKEIYRCSKQGDEPGIWKFEMWDKEHEKWVPSSPEIVIKDIIQEYGRFVTDRLKGKLATAMLAFLISEELGDDACEGCKDEECKTKTPTGKMLNDQLIQQLLKRMKEKGGNN
jgi:hypothetical protein